MRVKRYSQSAFEPSHAIEQGMSSGRIKQTLIKVNQVSFAHPNFWIFLGMTDLSLKFFRGHCWYSACTARFYENDIRFRVQIAQVSNRSKIYDVRSELQYPFVQHVVFGFVYLKQSFASCMRCQSSQRIIYRSVRDSFGFQREKFYAHVTLYESKYIDLSLIWVDHIVIDIPSHLFKRKRS